MFCYCRKSTDENCVVCCNPDCSIVSFHLSCLKIENIPKTWYCPHCRTLSQYKRSRKATKTSSSVPHPAMSLDSICICKSRPNDSEKLLQCHNESCDNGKFFHLICLNYKKMSNNSQTTWVCLQCKKKVKVTRPQNTDDVTFIRTVQTQTEKYKSLGNLGQKEFDIISSPSGWLDCSIIHDSQILLANVNKSLKRFQRPTLGPVRQYYTLKGSLILLEQW